MTEIERRNKGYLLKKGTKMAAKKKNTTRYYLGRTAELNQRPQADATKLNYLNKRIKGKKKLG